MTKFPQRNIFKFDKADWDKIRKEASTLNENYFNRNPDCHAVNENCEFMEKGIQSIIDKEIPSKLSKSKQQYPWITDSIKKSMQKRDRLYVKAMKTRSPETWKRFKDIRTATKEEIRNSRRNYVNTMIGENIKEDPKPFWSYIKALRSENSGTPTLYNKDGIPAATDTSKANTLVEQFTSVFSKENMDNLPPTQKLFPDMPTISFGEEGVEKLLKKINPTKAGGPDGIPARFLKETASEIAAMYTHLFSQSYKEGYPPKSWTHALVCPIFKKGKKSLPENYRPVSLTAIPCKLYEHIIVSQIWQHLNKYNIITSKQHGFRSGMSCETQLIEVLEDWTSAMNQGSAQIDVIVLDFSKAFDVVPHHRLLQKLSSYGITGQTNKWIEGFLMSRTHEVVVNGSKSSKHNVTSGVPQGTVLGPLLFLLYINDIENNLQSTIRLFADDSAIYREINSIDDAIVLQSDLFKLQEWADKWQMCFNVKKCKAMRITRRTKNKIDHTYVMSTPKSPTNIKVLPVVDAAARATLSVQPPNGSYSPLEEIQSDRYLGVILDNKLTFNSHVDTITQKATNLLNLCRRNLYMCPPEVKQIAYNSLIRPHLEYASAAWSPYTNRNIDKIEAVQRRAARFILNNHTYGPDAHLTSQIQTQLKWLPLQHRRALYDLSLFFKIKHNLINISFPPTVQPSPRNSLKYQHIQALYSDAFKYHFFTRTVRIWNLLPAEIVSIGSLETFKTQTVPWISPLAWQKSRNTWTLV